MSSVNEWVVREYLEALGFLVRQPRKYQVVARSKNLHEEVDLLAINPAVKGATVLPETLLWGARELSQVAGAVVAVRGWHSEKFTTAILTGSPEIYRFAEAESVKAAAAELGIERPARVLCMADLPADAEQRAEGPVLGLAAQLPDSLQRSNPGEIRLSEAPLAPAFFVNELVEVLGRDPHLPDV